MSFLKFFGNPPLKTQKLEFYIRPVETRTRNLKIRIERTKKVRPEAKKVQLESKDFVRLFCC